MASVEIKSLYENPYSSIEPVPFPYSHLSLNAVETSEPEDLSSPQLPLRVVDLFIFFVHVLFW